jgi:hypothetical protein
LSAVILTSSSALLCGEDDAFVVLMIGERRVGTGRFLAAFFVGWGTGRLLSWMADPTVFGARAVSAR